MDWFRYELPLSSCQRSYISFKCFSAAYQVVSGFGTFTSFRRSSKVEKKGLDKALKILDFVIPKTGKIIVGRDDRHQRVIQRSLQDLLELGQQKSSKLVKEAACRKLTEPTLVTSDCSFNNDVSSCWSTNILVEEDPLLSFHGLHKRSISPDATILSSIISSCGTKAALDTGLRLHAFSVKIGFYGCIPVGSSLISLYSKCGSADLVLDMLTEMDKQNILPDAITFLGVLSSCRHAGLVDKGRHYFNLMLRHGIKPELDHYSCIVDLLGRAGLLEEAVDFIEKMPIPANAVIWGSLLSSCRVHENVWIGIRAAERRLLLKPGCATTHVQLANLYASVGCWNNVANVRKLMKERGLKTTPGYSWIEIGNKVYRFKAEDGTNSELEEMLIILDTLGDHMQCLKYMLKSPLDDVN